MTDQEEVMKIVIIGEAIVGKTAIATRFADESFLEEYVASIGLDFFHKRIEINSRPCRLQIWDTAGQERYRSIITTFYRLADAAIVVYDLTRPETIEPLRDWVEDFKRRVREDVVFFLVGAKADLVSDPNDVIRTAEQLANEINATCTVTSAKENIGIDDTFVLIVQQISELRGLEDAVVTINLAEEKQSRKGRC